MSQPNNDMHRSRRSAILIMVSMPLGGPVMSSVRPVWDVEMFVTRTVRVGGKSKFELRQEFEQRGVKLNQAGEELFANPNFTTSGERFLLECVEVSVGDLGYATGATMEAICHKAVELGLSLCPLEVGPHMRLQYLDQPEGFLGHPPSQHRAPPGSLTVVSAPLSEDYETPKGFYLRRISGELWLRGYRSGPEHPWSPEDRLVFCRLLSAL